MQTTRSICVALVAASCISCQSIEQRVREREIESKPSEGGYAFRVWPGCSDTYSLEITGVTDTSEVLGPDFSVHYFKLGEDRSLAFYHGGHPRREDKSSVASFTSRVGKHNATWNLYDMEGYVKASTYVDATEGREGPPYLWHIMVAASDPSSAREIVKAVESFHMISQ